MKVSLLAGSLFALVLGSEMVSAQYGGCPPKGGSVAPLPIPSPPGPIFTPFPSPSPFVNWGGVTGPPRGGATPRPSGSTGGTTPGATNPGGTTPTAPPAGVATPPPGGTTPSGGAAPAGAAGQTTNGTTAAPAGAAGTTSGRPAGAAGTGGATPPRGTAAPTPSGGSGGATPSSGGGAVRPATGGAGVRPAGGSTPGYPSGGGAQRKMNAGFETAISWEWWWKYNGNEYLDVKKIVVESTPDLEKSNDGRVERDQLAERTRKSTLPFLRAGATDSDDAVRAASILALGKSGDQSCESLIIAALADKSIDVRENACLALGLLGTDSARSALLAIVLNNKEGAEMTGRDKGASLSMRGHAAAGLGIVGETSELSALEVDALMSLATTKSADADLNLSAIYALGFSRSQRAVPELIEIAKKGDADLLRSYAVTALGRIGDRAALHALTALLADKSLHVKRSATIALGELAQPSDQEAARKIKDLARDASDAATRRFAIMALGRIAGATEIECLLEILAKDDDASDASFAAVALGVASRKNPSLDREKAGERIHAALLKASSCETIGAYAIACGLLGRKEAAGDIEKILASRAHGHMRAECAQALGLMQSKDSLDLLSSTVETDADPLVRSAALQAIGILGEGRAAKLVSALMDRTGGNVVAGGATLRGFGLMGDGRAVVELGRTLRDTEGRSDALRAYAAMALGMIGDRSDVSPVRRLGQSENYVSQTGIIADLLAKSIL